jgi:hypothetical protein
VSGQKARLAGSDDLKKVLSEELESNAITEYQEYKQRKAEVDSGSQASNAIPESAFYRHLPRPQLMVYAITPEGLVAEHDSSAEPTANLRNAFGEDALLIALKIALPTSDADYRSSNGRAKYLLNKVAQKYWMADYEELV